VEREKSGGGLVSLYASAADLGTPDTMIKNMESGEYSPAINIFKPQCINFWVFSLLPGHPPRFTLADSLISPQGPHPPSQRDRRNKIGLNTAIIPYNWTYGATK
jgi:hypothetical protein